jgi:hypothetical protein
MILQDGIGNIMQISMTDGSLLYEDQHHPDILSLYLNAKTFFHFPYKMTHSSLSMY